MKLQPKRVVYVIAILMILLWSPACHEQDKGQQLAAAGKDTARTLATYYDSLAQDALDTWEMEAYLSSLRNVQFSQDEQQLLSNQISALKSRAEVARQMEATYDKLQMLSSYKASEEVASAVGGLETALQKAIPLPGGSDASGILKQAAGFLVGLKQGHAIKKYNEEIQKVITNLAKTFDQERPAYKSFSQERANKISAILSDLITKGYVNAWPLLQRIPESLGLSMTAPTGPTDQAGVEGLIAMAQVRERRLALLSAQTADEVFGALNSLIVAHSRFGRKESLTLDAVLQAEKRANSYLDEILKSKKTKGD